MTCHSEMNIKLEAFVN